MVVSALEDVLATEAARRDGAWRAFRGSLDLLASDADLAGLLLDDPSEHPWRLVDAALARLRCDVCGTELGGGARGCAGCDRADGLRFGGREPDRPAVPPGNEHAVRVALTIVRFPHRWPEEAVEGARLYLPRFAAGDLPTKAERSLLLAALRRGVGEQLADAGTFAEMAARARGSAGDGSGQRPPGERGVSGSS